MLGGEDAINVQFGVAAELIGNHWLKIPFTGENMLILVLELLQGPLKPGKPSLGILKTCIRLTYYLR